LLRNEIKYLLTYEEYLILSARIRAVLPMDKHASAPSGYKIGSLYLDDRYNSSYYEKIAGTANRSKYRVRAYNADDSFIMLECKETRKNMIQKESIRIDRATCDGIARGDFSLLADREEPMAREIYTLHREKGLMPRVIVTYRREAYCHPLSNTRITFDCELRATVNSYDLFDPDQVTRFIYPRNEVILEVKYDEYLPAHIGSLLSFRHCPVAASKFTLCCDAMSDASVYRVTPNQIIQSGDEAYEISHQRV
jgi:hypothetical protein